MDDYRMGLNSQGKNIWVNLCCFCERARITDQCTCMLALPASDQCAQFERCANVSDRVAVLVSRLPQNYGRPKNLINERIMIGAMPT